MEINKVYNEDCLDTMARMPDGFIDVTITDPPYGVDLKYDNYEDNESNWYDIMQKMIPEVKRVSKMAFIQSCQIKRLPWIYQNFPPDWILCWYKGSPGHVSYIGFNDWEPILIYGKKKGVQMHDYFVATPGNDKMGSFGHPCPKPIKWAKWLISKSSNEGDLIYDPFMGSGTVAVAAKEFKRNFIGSELSSDYTRIANKRIKDVAHQLF